MENHHPLSTSSKFTPNKMTTLPLAIVHPLALIGIFYDHFDDIQIFYKSVQTQHNLNPALSHPSSGIHFDTGSVQTHD